MINESLGWCLPSYNTPYEWNMGNGLRRKIWTRKYGSEYNSDRLETCLWKTIDPKASSLVQKCRPWHGQDAAVQVGVDLMTTFRMHAPRTKRLRRARKRKDDEKSCKSMIRRPSYITGYRCCHDRLPFQHSTKSIDTIPSAFRSTQTPALMLTHASVVSDRAKYRRLRQRPIASRSPRKRLPSPEPISSCQIKR